MRARPLQAIGHYVQRAVTSASGPAPWRRMLHFSASVALASAVCFLLGHPAESAVAAFAVLYVYFLDFGGAGPQRYPTILMGLALVVVCGTWGHALFHHPRDKIAVVLLLALLTGWAHGAGPRIAQIFRFGTVAFLVTAVLPEIGASEIPYVGLGAGIALGVAALEDLAVGAPPCLLPGALGRELRTLVLPPTRYIRFTLSYGLVAALGFALGERLGVARPYWVTITTIFAMQPASSPTLMRLFQRVAGTFVAVPITIVALSVARDPMIITLIMVATAFLIPLALVRNYLMASAVIVIFVIAALDLIYFNDGGALSFLWSRAYETFLGALLAAAGTVIAYADVKD